MKKYREPDISSFRASQTRDAQFRTNNGVVGFSFEIMKFWFDDIGLLGHPIRVSDIRCEGIEIANKFIKADKFLAVVDPLTLGE